jgi:serine protease
MFSTVAAVMILAVSSVFGQATLPGRVIIRIAPDAISSLRTLFAPEISTDVHFDPQKLSSHNELSIRGLLGLPSRIHAVSLAPFVAQHNVVLESLREHTNPILFNSKTLSTRVVETEALHLLRNSEEKLSRCFELQFDPSIPVQQIMILLRKSQAVELAEPRYTYHTCFIPNDSLLSEQYSISSMHLTKAWDIQRCDTTMLVAVDDIGTDWNHVDLRGAIYTNAGEMGFDSLGYDKRSNGIDDDGDGFIDDWHGWDFAGVDGSFPDNDPSTAAEHGTHTGGIMAAQGNNVTGVCGIAFGARLLVMKCGDDFGSNVAFGYEGMVYAADHGAKVVNNSWGGTGYSQVAQDVVDYATGKDCLVVAAAGNDNILEDLYPASYAHVLSVGAIDAGDNYAYFSTYGRHVDVCAPGQGVLSTVPFDRYKNLDGTSMASPNAAGVAALVRQHFPQLSPDQVAERIRATTRPLPVPSGAPQEFNTGHGIIQADSALDVTKPHHSVRIVAVAIDDPDGDGILQPGEAANITLSVRNYLDPTKKLMAHLEVLAPGPDNLSFTTQDVAFPDANTLDIVQNTSGTLHVNVFSTAGTDVVVPVRVTFSAGSDYVGDVDYFTLIINPSYLNLDKNNITTTISARGDFGYNDPPNNEQGAGFTWTNAPSTISTSGRSVLFEAGLMVATDPDHVVAAAPNENTDLFTDQDFRVIRPAHYVFEPDHAGALQEIESNFDDGLTDSSHMAKQVGVTVHSRAYAFGGAAANAEVLDYSLSYVAPANGNGASDFTAAALYMDWDIGSSGANNVAAPSPLDSTIAVTRRIEDGYPLVGVKIISKIPVGASYNFYAMENDGSNGSVGVYNGFPQIDKWESMTTPRLNAGPNDVSMICGLANLPLASTDSIRITYVIGLGVDDSDLKRTIDNATLQWFGASDVRSVSSNQRKFFYYPNPCEQVLHINSPFTGTQHVKIVDALGRVVYDKSTRSSEATLELSSLAAGAYRLIVTCGGDDVGGSLIVR